MQPGCLGGYGCALAPGIVGAIIGELWVWGFPVATLLFGALLMFGVRGKRLQDEAEQREQAAPPSS